MNGRRKRGKMNLLRKMFQKKENLYRNDIAGKMKMAPPDPLKKVRRIRTLGYHGERGYRWPTIPDSNKEET